MEQNTYPVDGTYRLNVAQDARAELFKMLKDSYNGEVNVKIRLAMTRGIWSFLLLIIAVIMLLTIRPGSEHAPSFIMNLRDATRYYLLFPFSIITVCPLVYMLLCIMSVLTHVNSRNILFADLGVAQKDDRGIDGDSVKLLEMDITESYMRHFLIMVLSKPDWIQLESMEKEPDSPDIKITYWSGEHCVPDKKTSFLCTRHGLCAFLEVNHVAIQKI